MSKRIFILAAFCIFICHSVSAQTVTGISVSKYQATYAESTPKFFPVPVVADVQLMKDANQRFIFNGSINIPSSTVGETTTAYTNRLTNHIKTRIEDLKAQALYEFAESVEADLILSPTYSVVTTESSSSSIQVQVKIKGFPAKYTNFRPMTSSDCDVVRAATAIEDKAEIHTVESKTVSNTEKVITR